LLKKSLSFKIRHRFASAAAAGISPLDFSIKLLKLWGGILDEVKSKPLKQKNTRESPGKRKADSKISKIVENNVISGASAKNDISEGVHADSVKTLSPQTIETNTPNSTSEPPKEQLDNAQVDNMYIIQTEATRPTQSYAENPSADVPGVQAVNVEAKLLKVNDTCGPVSISEVPLEKPNKIKLDFMGISHAEGSYLNTSADVPTDALGTVGARPEIGWEQPISEISMSERAPSLYDGIEEKDGAAVPDEYN
jgi:hypothetical protein